MKYNQIKTKLNEEHSLGLLKKVAAQMDKDARNGDYNSIDELLEDIPTERLEGYLSDNLYPYVEEAEADDLYHDNVKKVGQKDYNDYKGIQIHNLRKELKRVRKILLNLQDIESKDNSSDMVQNIRNMLGGYEQMIDNMESAFEKLNVGRHRTESVTIDKDDKLASLKVIDPNNRRHDDTLNKYSPKQIKMAFGILNDPRYRDGNYDGAYAAIEKLAKGLASHPSVAKALKRANESIVKEADEDGDGKEDLKGFDAKTSYALKALQVKYPHADNLMSAMAAQSEETNRRQDDGDKKRDALDKLHNKNINTIEQKLFDVIRKNNLKEEVVNEIDPSRSPWTVSGKHPGAMSQRELEREIAVFDELRDRGDHLSPRELAQEDSLYHYLESSRQRSIGEMQAEDMQKHANRIIEKAKWKKQRAEGIEDIAKAHTKKHTLPRLDTERYQERDGLEGPIMTKSGKVVYYDPKEDLYYDPDKDMYIDATDYDRYADNYDYHNKRR